jgi:hypothetical protein
MANKLAALNTLGTLASNPQQIDAITKQLKGIVSGVSPTITQNVTRGPDTLDLALKRLGSAINVSWVLVISIIAFLVMTIYIWARKGCSSRTPQAQPNLETGRHYQEPTYIPIRTGSPGPGVIGRPIFRMDPGPTKCFSCEQQMIATHQSPGLANPTKCFACQKQIIAQGQDPTLGNTTRCFSCQDQGM